jgi:transcriptional regulator with XRE-family HTH domain
VELTLPVKKKPHKPSRVVLANAAKRAAIRQEVSARLAQTPSWTLPFAELLQAYRHRTGLGSTLLGANAGVDPSYLTRMELGERSPTRYMVESLAHPLALSPAERDRLLVASRFAPDALCAVGWSPAVATVVEALGSPSFGEEFAQVVGNIARQYLRKE